MSAIQNLTVTELAQWRADNRAFVLLDVREDDEVNYASIDGYIHIPMNFIPLRHNELPDDKPIVIYCHHGVRSMNVAMFLARAGFEQLYNVTGGIDEWSKQIDPTIPKY